MQDKKKKKAHHSRANPYSVPDKISDSHPESAETFVILVFSQSAKAFDTVDHNIFIYLIENSIL